MGEYIQFLYGIIYGLLTIKYKTMRLSKFQTKTIWLIGLTILVVIAFKLEFKAIYINSLILLFRIFSVLFLFLWSIGLTETLQEIAALKYKITEERWCVSAKYLTFWWIIIPYWKPIDTTSHSFEEQNIFGAKTNSYYSNDVTYKDKGEAISAIEKHKATIRKNRKDWFEITKPDAKKVTYM